MRPMEGPKPLRGEIWMFDLNPKKGREQKGVRPCLVVSTDALNRSDFGTVIIRCRAHRWRRVWEPYPSWPVSLIPTRCPSCPHLHRV